MHISQTDLLINKAICMRDISHYSNSKDFLQESFKNIQSNDSNYSIRKFAKLLKVSSHGTLYLMLTGKRRTTKSVVQRLAEVFQLGALEKRYLITLVEKEGTKSKKIKNELDVVLVKLISEIQKNKPVIINSETVQKDPIHFSILELIGLEGMKNDPVKISKMLKHKYQIDEIESAIKNLKDNQLIHIDTKKILIRTKNSLVYSETDSKKINDNIKSHHKKLCTLASESLDAQNIDEREFQSLMFNIKNSSINSLKKDMKNFVLEMMNKYECLQNEGESTYNLNVQCFQIASRIR